MSSEMVYIFSECEFFIDILKRKIFTFKAIKPQFKNSKRALNRTTSVIFTILQIRSVKIPKSVVPEFILTTDLSIHDGLTNKKP